MRSIQHISYIFALLFCCSSVFSATRLVDGSGMITGATGVSVDGALYDVAFETGSCNSLFNNCSPDDFSFQNQQLSDAAAQALNNQVFNTIIPSVQNIAGCNNWLYCYFATPYLRDGSSVNSSLLTVYSQYYSANSLGWLIADVSSDISTGGSYGVYVLWTPLATPVPSAAWLFGSGLIGLAGFYKLRAA